MSLLRDLVRAERRRLAGSVLLGAGAVGASVGLMATSAWLIARAAQHPSVQALAVAVVGVRFFGIARGLLRYGERLVGHDAALRVLADLRVRFYGQLERLAPAGLPAFRSGDLLARLVGDVDAQQDLLLRVVSPLAVAVVTSAAVVALTAWVDVALAVVLGLALLLATVLVPAVTSWQARRSDARQAHARGELGQAVVDLLQGAPDLVVLGAARRQLDLVARLDARLTDLQRVSARTAGLGAALTALLAGAAVWGSAVVGIEAVRSGRLDGVLLAVVVLVPLAAFEAVNGLPAAAQVHVGARASGDRLAAVLDARPPVSDPVDPVVPAVGAGEPGMSGPVVRLRGAGASWPGADRPALEGVDLDLPPGRRVAVVGPSGAGKSTLAALLVRFLPYTGSVTLDGTEIDRMAGDDVRRRVGLVAQDAHVFDTTLAENVRVGRPGATDEQVADALAAARLDGWVASLPDGLATRAGERGGALSGGQRQRLVVARALLADPPVLVLDEPGEHLDTATADALTADLVAATRGRTALLVTHRLLGLDAVDEVLVLDHGRVVERGSHAELLAAGGPYRALWDRERATDALAAPPHPDLSG